MPNERPSARELFAGLVGDPWRKLVSILLGVLLWFYLDAQVSEKADLGLTFAPTHEASDLDTSIRQRLFVRMDTNSYTVLAFEDAQTGEVVPGVTLHLAGAKKQMQSLDDNPGFTVRIEPSNEQDELVATFAAEDVQPVNSRFDGLVASMTPPRIRVHLGLNDMRSVVLNPDRLEIRMPAGAPGLAKRLVWEDARFQPEGVTLRGPKSLVDSFLEHGKLFVFQPDAPGAQATRLEVALRPIELPRGLTLLAETAVLRIPLRIEPHLFRLPDVRVLLDERSAPGRFRLRNDTANVEIEALGQLEARLSGLTQDELRAWVRDNALLVASLPKDAEVPDVILNSQLLIPGFYDSVHYRMTLPPDIHFEPKNP